MSAIVPIPPVTAIASDDQRFGLVVQPSGIFRLLVWLPVSTPRHVLCCDTARLVDLTATLTV
jgi:hypothetical protein